MSSPTLNQHSIGFTEFLILLGAMMACQALSIDAMLPALPEIAQALGVTDENRTQWIVTAYLAGVGVGQLFWGMMSDRFGRRPILLVGLALYVIAALLVATSLTFETLLIWRFVHGTAGASLVVSRSVIRDLYEGRQMARVMSLTFIVFIIVPIIAPSIGQLILWFASWRMLFVTFGVLAVALWLWVLLRLPETLHAEHRLTITLQNVSHSTRQVLTERASLLYTLALTVLLGSLLAYVGMVQQIFATVFHRPALMPTIFAVCAAAMGVASFLNSRIVERVGMRIASQAGLLLFIVFSGVHVVVILLGHEVLLTFVILQAGTLGCVGLMLGNFGAMAMESMGSIAGMAASLQGFISTLGAALIGALIGRLFVDSTMPLALGSFLCGVAGLVLVLIAERGRLFKPHHAGS